MKFQMKLRTRLFLGFSALMTVALLGLSLALVSVMQMAKSQETLIKDNFGIIEVNQQLRQALGNHLLILLRENRDSEALAQSREVFQTALAKGIAGSADEADRQAFQTIGNAYAAFLNELQMPNNLQWTLLEDNALSQSFNYVRELMVEMQQSAYDQIRDTEIRSRERAQLLAGLLGLTGIAVLLIGFITAHSFARRFGEPIERLAGVADQIGRGDFDIALPRSPIAELSSLIHRFGLMSQALHRFKQTNVEALVNGQQRLQALLDSIDDGLLIVDRQGGLSTPIRLPSASWPGRPNTWARLSARRSAIPSWTKPRARCSTTNRCPARPRIW